MIMMSLIKFIPILKVGSDAYNAAIIECVWREDGSIESKRKQPADVSLQWIEAKNYEPHVGVQQLVDDRRRFLNELEAAQLFLSHQLLKRFQTMMEHSPQLNSKCFPETLCHWTNKMISFSPFLFLIASYFLPLRPSISSLIISSLWKNHIIQT